VLVTAEAAVEEMRLAVSKVVDGPSGRIALIASTTGAGKSRAVQEVAAGSAMPWDIFVPTHALAEQYEESLADLGVDGQTWRKRGPTGLRLEGELVCLRPKEAEGLSRAGVNVLKRLCGSCSYRDAHPLSGGTCPAYESATPKTTAKPRITLHQMARVAETLSAMLIRDLTSATASQRVVVIDEPPPLLCTTTLGERELAAAAAVVHAARKSARDKLAGPLAEFAERVTSNQISDGITGAALLGDRLCAALRKVGDIPLAAHHQSALVGPAASSALKHFADGHALLNALREIAWASTRKCVRTNENGHIVLATRAPWVRQARLWQRRGGRILILDATAQARDYRALMVPRKDRQSLLAHTLHVHDAPTVTRCFYRWASGARTRHLNGTRVRWDEFHGVLRFIAGKVKETGGPVGIITDKPTAAALAEEMRLVREDDKKSLVFPSEFADLLRQELEVNLGWYGNQRGLDAWADNRVLVTLGDPFPELDSVRAEALLLGRKEFAHSFARCMSEIVQASGRARAVHRTCPILIIHAGKAMPPEWLAPQWRTVKPDKPTKGRPKKKLAGGVSDEDLLREHAAGASQGELARKYGLAKSTINERLRRLQPTRGAPSQLVTLSPKVTLEEDAALTDDDCDACIDGSDVRRAVRFLSAVGAAGLDTAGSQGFLCTMTADGCRLHTNSSSSVVASSPVLVNEASAHTSPFILPAQRWRSIARYYQGPVRFAWGDGSMNYTSGDGAAGTCRSIASKFIEPLEAVPANAAVLGSIPAPILESVLTVGRKHLPRSPRPTLELRQGNRLALCGDTFKVQFECAEADFTRNTVLNPRAAKPLLALCRSARGGLITLHALADRIYAVNARGDLASWSNGTEAAPSNMWSVRNAVYECFVNTRDWCRAIGFVEANMGYDDRRMVTLGFGRALALRSSGKEHKAHADVPTIERTYSREIEGLFCIDELLHILRNARAEEVRISVSRERGRQDTGALLLIGTCDESPLPTGRGATMHGLRATWFAVGTELAKPQVRGPLLLTSGT
jgi:hypothetical protein